MITSVKVAELMECCSDRTKKCGVDRCMGWEWYVQPTEIIKGKPTHGKDGHGLKRTEKLGYCGLSKRR